MTLQELEQIKQRVLSERSMGQDKSTHRVTVGMGTCGIKAGAGSVLEEMRRALAGAENVILTHVGCLGLCSYEPLVEVADPDGRITTYCHMTPGKARKVIAEHLIGGRPVKEWALASGSTAGDL